MDYYSHTYVTAAHKTPTDDEDLCAAPIVEVSVLWGDQVLDVQHLEAPYTFVLQAVGTKARHNGRAGSFLLPEDTLQNTSIALVTQSARGMVVLLDELPNDTHIYLPEQKVVATAELASQARTLGSVHEGAAAWPLGEAVTELRIADFRILLSVTSAAKRVPRALFSSTNSADVTYFGLSFLSAAGVLLSAAFFSPPLSLTAGESLTRNDLILMQQYLDAAAEREEERKLELGPSDKDAQGGEPGERAQQSEGAMGDNQKTERNRRYQIKGPIDNPDPHMARAAALQDAITFGTIGLLNSVTGDANSPTALWAQADALGRDAQSYNGVMWADGVGSAFGAGGLGLTSWGDGGGGSGEGIGVGVIGTFNRGLGGVDGSFGAGHGRVRGTHQTRVFSVRAAGPVGVSGRLPPQVIQRIVRQNHGRFRVCYEKGLAANPSLAGRVNVRFVIGRNGAVTNVSNGGSSLPATDVVNCVVRGFYGLSFPTPEGGLVKVSYPLSFSPG
jgi:hypothetical protein